MTLQADTDLDLVSSTQKELGEMKLTLIASDLQKYIAVRELLRKNRRTIDGGNVIQWNLQTDYRRGQTWVGFFAQDQEGVVDVLRQAQIPWRHVTNNYSIDRKEIAVNASPRRIIDLVKLRRNQMMIDFAADLETRFWRVPSVSNDVLPYGAPYYIVKSSQTTGDKNGTVPSGYTLVANVNPTTVDRWTNWARAYTNVTKDDLFRTLREGAYKTNFQPPIDGIKQYDTGTDYGWYTNYAVVQRAEEVLESQNENLGTDVAPMDGKVLFKRRPMQAVPQLDEDTTNPVYGIQWGEFKTVTLPGRWMKETRIENKPGQHDTIVSYMDTTLNWMCTNRRVQMVVSTGTTMP